eukprot:CAMPEP_0168781402 /NCGR_PEP_ID=MMETSP0725-20121227/8617_1 /TAXON_ID=265536 /ORGANISM="Amphiprora sp., Strain CCMP467" /LENGTH=643 /DNA_ID=CAMNT_0008831277 /DNA_START=50 /DNA_END=1977 /DNA_ORIENTATION=+
MDFASALERLEKTADAASSRNNNNNDGRGGGDGGRGRGRGERHHHRGGGYRGGGGGDGYRGGGGGDFRGGRRRGRPEYNNNNNNSRDYRDGDYGHRRPQRARMDHYRGGGRNDRGYGRGGGGGRYQSQQQQRSPLDELQRYGYRVESYRPPRELPADLGRRPFHICLLAICIDDLPFEHIWRAWANHCNNSTPNNDNDTDEQPHQPPPVIVSLLCHAKYPLDVKSEWLQRHIITRPPRMGRGNSFADPEYLTHTPEWGSVQITHAMVDLLRQAHLIGTTHDERYLKEQQDPRFSNKRFLVNVNENDTSVMETIPPVDKFLFISETCLPVQTLPEFAQAFFGPPDLYRNMETVVISEPSRSNNDNSDNDKKEPKMGLKRPDPDQPTPWEVSWVNAKNRNSPNTPRNKYESDQFATVHRMIHGHYRWKADQWCALSRPHATALVNIDNHYASTYNDQLWKTGFYNVSASDEMYIPCCLAVLQILLSDVPLSQNPNNPASAKVTAPPLQLRQVAQRAVTYTDWSEGMRNPLSFFQGPTDLHKICRAARHQGSLVARKFTLQRSPDDPVTGTIEVEEWKAILKEVAEREAVEKEEEAAAAAKEAEAKAAAEQAQAEANKTESTATEEADAGKQDTEQGTEQQQEGET